MNLYALLQLPWRAVHRSLRWLAVFVRGCCGAGALAIGLLTNGAHRWQGALVLFGLGLFFAWGFFYSVVLLLAIDTHRLRVPRVQQRIIASLLLHGLLTVALPLAVLVPAGLPWLAPAVALGLFVVFGLLFALMPRYLAIFIGIVPSLLGRVWKLLHLPGLLEPQFVSWFGPLLLAMLLLVAWRWHILLRSGGGQVRSWSSPMVLQFRSGSCGGNGATWATTTSCASGRSGCWPSQACKAWGRRRRAGRCGWRSVAGTCRRPHAAMRSSWAYCWHPPACRYW